MLIRSFIEDDYPEITRLHNQAYGDFAKYVDELRFRDCHYPEGFQWARWTAIDNDDKVVGFAEYHNIQGMFHRQKFAFDMAVDQKADGDGIASRLYETVMQALDPLQPISVASWARADMTSLTSFLTHRGFEPTNQMFTSSVDLRAFEAERWHSRVTAAERDGLQVRSFEALGVDDPIVRRKVYELWCDVRQDVPIPDGEVLSEPMDVETFWQQMTAGPALMPAGFFIAVQREEFVGMSQLWLSPVDDVLRTGLTAVRRAYRRRGIALALKVRALSYAQALGYRQVVTDNAAVNEGMLAINGALGFVRNPVWTRYVKTLSHA